MNRVAAVGFDSLLADGVLHSDVGDNPRASTAGQAVYRALRDARAAARDEERRQETAEADVRDLRLHKNWAEIQRLANKLLAEVGSDIEVLVWLCESETRVDGYEGLAKSVRLISSMVRAHGRALHPVPQDQDDDQFAALAGLNGVGREGTLVQPLRLLPLVPGFGYGEMTLWHVLSDRDSAHVQQAMASAGSEAMSARLEEVAEAGRALRDCDVALTELLGPASPPFSQLIDVIEETERTIRRLSGLKTPEPASPADAQPAKAHGKPRASDLPPGEISSREQALAELSRIAAYFRRTEPHSPISESLETLVRRGRMDFVSLIAELIPDDAARQSLMTTAGIGRAAPDPTKGE